MSPLPQPASPPPDVPDITATEPDVEVEGHAVYFVWNPPQAVHARRNPDGTIMAELLGGPSIPKGMLVHHADPRDDTPCIAWLAWARAPGEEGPIWTLLSLDPLSIAEPFICSRCGAAGGIREGQWWACLA